jgi:hypothetical protein
MAIPEPRNAGITYIIALSPSRDEDETPPLCGRAEVELGLGRGGEYKAPNDDLGWVRAYQVKPRPAQQEE